MRSKYLEIPDDKQRLTIDEASPQDSETFISLSMSKFKYLTVK